MKSKEWKNNYKHYVRNVTLDGAHRRKREEVKALVIDINRLAKQPGEYDSFAGKCFEKMRKNSVKRLIQNGGLLVSGHVWRHRRKDIGVYIGQASNMDVIYVRPYPQFRRLCDSISNGIAVINYQKVKDFIE